MLKFVSLDTFTLGKPVFVPVTNYMLLADLHAQCSQKPEQVVFLLDDTVNTGEEYLESIKRLTGLGYRFAIQKLTNIEPYAQILPLCDYILFDHRNIDEREQQILRILVGRDYKHLKAVYTHIMTKEMFEIVSKHAPGWYEGRFYRTPLTKGSAAKVSPLDVNLINLSNEVRGNDFEFTKVAQIISKDTALSIALLKLVNSAYFGARHKISSINQAVAMLGQNEIRKWITTAVSRLLGADKPGEVTRISLLRARFAEVLAPKFGLDGESESLFLMGLFSVLDAVLDIPMDEALKLVHVSDKIYSALVERSGDYFPIYDFMLQYEAANWSVISRILLLNNIPVDDIYDCYVDSLKWYRDIVTEG
jgi:EAL and modified HD-GYP domain-containing signal transduction protein